jgi:WD40 repeat protein
LFKLIKKYKKHNGPIYAVTYSRKHNLLFTGGSDRVVATWDLKKEENTPLTIKTDSAVLNVQLINEEKHLLIGLFNGDFHIIDLSTRKELCFFSNHKLGIFSSYFIQHINLLFVGAGDGTISIWDTNEFILLKTHNLSKGKIRAIQIVGDYAFVGNSQGQIFKIDTLNVKECVLFYELDHPIFCLNYNENKNTLLVGDKNAHLTVIDIDKQKISASIPAHNWPIYKIEWLNTDEFATCSRDKIIKIWDARSMKVKQRLCYPDFQGHLNSVNNLVTIRHPELLVSVGDDKQICVWGKE